ncbi:MAG: choice-of-anchor D domain-containing protein [Acidobacteriota bacterium]
MRTAIGLSPRLGTLLNGVAAAAFLLLSVSPLSSQSLPPVITNLSPNTANAGGPGFILTVDGSNLEFMGSSTVNWNGSPRSTTVVSSTRVTAAILATDLRFSGVQLVTVTNALGTSAPARFSVLPSISSFNPPSAIAGDPAFSLSIFGAGFIGDGGDDVTWNGASRPTTYISDTQLSVDISASDIAVAGTVSIAVTNIFEKLTSVPVSYSINNPFPSLTGLSPSSTLVGNPGFTLGVTGSSFVPGAVVRWNGSNRPTTVVSTTHLDAAIPASDLTSPGNVQVTVQNPAPGGGISSPITFTISPPQLSVSPTLVDFGEVLIGTTSSKTVTVSNLESSALQIQGSTSANSPYSVSPTSFLLEGNGSRTVTVTFAPQTASSFNAVASFLVPASGGERVINLTGRGVSTLFTFSYTLSGQIPVTIQSGGTVPFPSTDVGGRSSVLFTVRNVGPSTASLGALASDNPQFILSEVPALPLSLASNETVTFTVSFAPTAAGNALGMLSINERRFVLTGSATISPLSYRYTLEGQAPSAISSGGTIPFPSISAGSSGSAEFEISNSSSSPVVVNNIQTGTSGPFGLSGLPALPLTVAAGGSSRFTITFSPEVPDDFSDTLLVGNRTFELTGTALARGLTLTGLTDNVPPAQQPKVGVDLVSPYDIPLSGQLLLTFTPNADVPSDDPAVQFATGGRAVDFMVPARETKGRFGGEALDVAFSTGTVAGTLRFSVVLRNGESEVTPVPDPGRTVTVERSAPTISSVSIASRTASGFEIVVTGYSTTRSLTQAVFRFSARSGSNVQGGDVTVNLSNAFTSWYESADSKTFGSQFRLRVPFTVQGDINAIGSVSVTLTNATGSSTPATANF